MRTNASNVHAMCLPIAQTHWAASRVPAFRAIAAMASIVKVSASHIVSISIMTDRPASPTTTAQQMIVVAVLDFRQSLLYYLYPVSRRQSRLPIDLNANGLFRWRSLSQVISNRLKCPASIWKCNKRRAGHHNNGNSANNNMKAFLSAYNGISSVYLASEVIIMTV